MLTQPVDSERLLVRCFERDDWHSLYAYSADPGVMANLPAGAFRAEQTGALIEEKRGAEPKAYAVICKHDQRLVGHMLFHPWFAPQLCHRRGIRPAWPGKGYASEAALALLRYGIAELQLQRIVGTCQPQNAPS